MKRFLFTCIALSFFSCKQNHEAEVKTAPTQAKEITTGSKDLNATGETLAVSFTKETSTQMYEAYLELKAALVNTDAQDASAIAADFQEMLGAITTERDPENLNKQLNKIAVSEDVEVQRAAFENVSSEVEAFISNDIASGSIAKQYCPMAFDFKGAYWLSDSNEIRNPYFGDKMLKCGKVEETLK